MQIDFAQAVTAETKAQAAALARATSIKTDCRTRILAASGLRDGDLTLAQGWKAWVAAMQTECRRAIDSGEGPVWPDLPKGVADLAARF